MTPKLEEFTNKELINALCVYLEETGLSSGNMNITNVYINIAKDISTGKWLEFFEVEE